MKFPVKSATYAMKGKQLLNQEGIRSSVGKSVSHDGCFYYLSVSDRYAKAAEEILEDHDILKQ